MVVSFIEKAEMAILLINIKTILFIIIFTGNKISYVRLIIKEVIFTLKIKDDANKIRLNISNE